MRYLLPVPPTDFLDITRVYKEVPDVYDDLSFYVPCQTPIHIRCVEIRDTTYELWSPNSDRIDYYPGAPLKEPVDSFDATSCYHDGRLGPHDWTLHPQHFYAKRPWLGFCSCPPVDVRDWRSVLPELVPLSLVWVPSTSTRGKGSLNPEFLSSFSERAASLYARTLDFRTSDFPTPSLEHVLSHRPLYPATCDFALLTESPVWTWEVLVPRFVGIQRGLREMEAWLTMMKYWRWRRSMKPFSIPQVEPGRIGVWLNGASKADGLWLLRLGIIPVYIIHQYTEGVDFPSPTSDAIMDRRAPPARRRPDFVHRTPAELLNSPETNPYLNVPYRTSALKIRPFAPDQFNRGLRPASKAKYRARSASWAFRVRMREHQVLDESDSGHLSAEEDSVPPVPFRPVYTTRLPVPSDTAQCRPLNNSDRNDLGTPNGSDWGCYNGWWNDLSHHRALSNSGCRSDGVVRGGSSRSRIYNRGMAEPRGSSSASNSHHGDRSRHDDIDDVRDVGWNVDGRSDNVWGQHSYEDQSFFHPIPIDYVGGGSSSSQRPASHGSPAPGEIVTSSNLKTLGDFVTEDSVSFWKPPPVAYGPRLQQTRKSKGRKKSKSKGALWHRYVEVDSKIEPGLCLFVKEGQTAMVLKSQQMVSEEDAAFQSETETPDRQPGRQTFWDRHNHRRLTFIRPINYTSGVYYDHSIFGFPLPQMTYVKGTSKQGFLPVKNSSSWAYIQPHPMSERIGSEPLLEECCPRPSLSKQPLTSLSSSIVQVAVHTDQMSLHDTGRITAGLSVPDAENVDLMSVDGTAHKQKSQCVEFLSLLDDCHIEEEEQLDWGDDSEDDLAAVQKPDSLPPSAPSEHWASSRELSGVQDATINDTATSLFTTFIHRESYQPDHEHELWRIENEVVSMKTPDYDADSGGAELCTEDSEADAVESYSVSGLPEVTSLCTWNETEVIQSNSVKIVTADDMSSTIALSDMDVDTAVDLPGPTFRVFEQIPKMAESSTVYLCCGMKESIAVKEFISAICEEHSYRSGLRSVHRDPLPIHGTTHHGFVLQFISAAQSALVYKTVSIPGWSYIPESFAAEVSLAAADSWKFKAPAIDPNIWGNPLGTLPFMRHASSSVSGESSTANIPHLPVLTLPPLVAPPSSVAPVPPPSSGSHRTLQERVTPRLSPYPSPNQPQCDTPLPRESTMKLRRQRGAAKRTRTGHRQALFERFGMHFWEFLKIMTPEQFANCTPEQQKYITDRRASKEMCQ